MTPTEFIMLRTGSEVRKLVSAAWKPQISPIELVRKIVPRSFEVRFFGRSKIHKGLIMSSFKRGARTYISCMYLNSLVDVIMSMLTGEVFKIDMATRGNDGIWMYYKVKDND